MRQLHCSYKILPRKITESFKQTLLLNENLSESDILEVQDRFLTNGFSPIKVKDIQAGRYIIDTFLSVLPVYQDVGSLTLAEQPLKNEIFDIYSELNFGGYLRTQEQRLMSDFFCEKFYCDFIWIEATNNLLVARWFDTFIQEIFNYKLEKHIPILVFSYQTQR